MRIPCIFDLQTEKTFSLAAKIPLCFTYNSLAIVGAEKYFATAQLYIETSHLSEL